VTLLQAGLLAAGAESSRRANDLHLAVDTRWAGGANGGYYPIRISLTNLARPRSLEFVFTDTGGSGSREPTVTRQVLIDQNVTQRFTLPVPLVSSGTYGQLRVFENGRELEALTQHVSLPDSQPGWADRPALLVISPNLAAADCAKFEQAVESLTLTGGASRATWGGSYGGGSPRSNDFQVIPPQMLPEAWIDYTTLDIVAIPLANLEKATAEARGALLRWVTAGGTLIVYEVGKPPRESADLARLLDLANRPPSSQSWHPADPALHKPIALISAGGSGSMAVFTAPAGPPGVGAEVAAPAVDEQGNLIDLANKPLWPVTADAFSRIDFLTGQVFAFPGSPFPGAAVDWGWWLNSAKLPQLKWTTRNGLSSRQQHPDFYQFLIPGVGAVPVLAFIVLITIFAIVIGPVNYFIVARRRQLFLLVLTIPTIAFLTSAALFGYAMIADGFGVQSRLRSFTLLDQYSKTAVSFNRISLFAGIVPSAGLKFSPDTAVFPVWPRESDFESGSVDWTNTQHLSRGWLRSSTPAQFETISVRSERARIDIKPAGTGEIEAANGLEWNISLLVVKDEASRLYSVRKLPAGATMKATTATPEDLQALSAALSNDPLVAPTGAGLQDYGPFDRSTRRAMMHGYYGRQETPASFASSLLETNLKLLNRPAQEPVAGGMHLRTYLAVLSQNPGIELGFERTRPAAGLQVVMGYY
jgi:hypothetical protein